MDKKALIYLLKLVIQKSLGLFLYLIGKGWLLNQRATVYFSIYITGTILSGLIMFQINSKTLAERNKINTDSPKWDKFLLVTFWLLEFFVIYFLAGLESNKLIENIEISFWIGITINIISWSFALWAMIENTFLESTARIQNNRNQFVIQSGPYKIVRLPVYLSVIFSNIGICLVFPTFSVIICATIIILIIIIRTYLEDVILQVD